MIVYQLPNGKIVYLTVEQFLSMTDDDIKYMTENNFGTDVYNPFSIKTSSSSEDYYYDKADDLDYENDDDDEPSEPFNLDNLFEE